MNTPKRLTLFLKFISCEDVKMKVKIKSYSELPSYLSIDKIYDVVKEHEDDLVSIQDDDGDVVIYLNNSSHLGDGTWEVVYE